MALLQLPQFPRVDFELNDSADRIRYTAQLYHANKAPLIIVTGGNVFPQGGIEAESVYIKQLLTEWSVPESNIIIESNSRNTYENALYVKSILKKKCNQQSAISYLRYAHASCLCRIRFTTN